ncbi:MAG: hypothetical protein GWP03_05905 [Proteobacteria bacterium]|nr:hypothetical protein [Pseudomonadota bacterium]
MLMKQKEYLRYLNKVETKLESIELPASIRDSFYLKPLQQAIKDRELLIPVVGAFSAGKSTLINSFIEKDILPVGITPSTALATELRYVESGNERIEAVKADSTFDTFSLEEITNLGKIAYKYKFIRLFISNPRLLEIQPLVLVDMPGFESPLDLHNQAIMEYINKGVYYIVLISVEDGTITRSMLRQLEDIQEYKRDFSFFLSKSDLRSKEEVEEIKSNLQKELKNDLDLNKQVIAIDSNSGNSLKQALSQIDPEELFKSLFVYDLKDSYYSINEAINTCVLSLSKSKEENEQAINALQQSIESIISERDRMIKEAKEKYSDVNINRIVDNVGRELSNSMEELVNAAINGGQDALSNVASEIIRHALISNISESVSEISDEIIETFSDNLTKLSDSSSDFALSDNFLKRISDTTKEMLSRGKSGLQDLLEKREDKKGAYYKAITSVLAITTNVLAPIIEVIIVFLPDILSGIIGYFQKEAQKNKIRNFILTDMIPSVKRKLRESLPDIFNKQVEEMIKSISERFENEIAQKRDAIKSTQEEIKKRITNIDVTISHYKTVSNEIKTLTNTIVFE